jgi:hypothetical protein
MNSVLFPIGLLRELCRLIWRFDVASGSLTADTIEDLCLLAT